MENPFIPPDPRFYAIERALGRPAKRWSYFARWRDGGGE